MIAFFAINPAEPSGTRNSGFESYGFFSAGDCGVILLGLVVGFGKEEVDFGVAGILFRALLRSCAAWE